MERRPLTSYTISTSRRFTLKKLLSSTLVNLHFTTKSFPSSPEMQSSWYLFLYIEHHHRNFRRSQLRIARLRGKLHSQNQVSITLSRNFGLNFIYGKKLGAYHDHEFAKRAIRILAGEDLTFVGVHFYSGNSANTLEYLNKRIFSLKQNVLDSSIRMRTKLPLKTPRTRSKIAGKLRYDYYNCHLMDLRLHFIRLINNNEQVGRIETRKMLTITARKSFYPLAVRIAHRAAKTVHKQEDDHPRASILQS